MTDLSPIDFALTSGLLSEEDFIKAQNAQSTHGGTLESHVLEQRFLTEEQLLWCCSSCYGMPSAHPWDIQHIQPSLSNSITRTTAEAYLVLPLYSTNDTLTVVTHKNPDPMLLKRLQKETQRQHIHTLVSLPLRIQEGLKRLYGTPLTPRTQHLLNTLPKNVVSHQSPTHTNIPVIDWNRRTQRLENASTLHALFTEWMAALEEATGFAALFQYDGNTFELVRSTTPSVAHPTPTVHLSSHDASVLAHVVSTKTCFYGTVPYNTCNYTLLSKMQRPSECTALVWPVLLGNHTAGVLYCDNATSPLLPSQKEALCTFSESVHEKIASLAHTLQTHTGLRALLQPTHTASTRPTHTLKTPSTEHVFCATAALLPQQRTEKWASLGISKEWHETALNMLKHPNPLFRMCALEYFHTHPSLSPFTEISQRLYDSKPDIRLSATEWVLAHKSHTHYTHLFDHLISLLNFPHIATQTNSIVLLGHLRDTRAIDFIIPFTASPWKPVYTSALCALTLLCMRNLGKNVLAWETFWHTHKHENRMQWIEEALQSNTHTLRMLAHDELERHHKQHKATQNATQSAA